RYRSPNEVMDVEKKYFALGINLSTIANDYFHWPKQGEYRFDEVYWPQPDQFLRPLRDVYNVEPIISIWPTVQTDAMN
ncbi:TIM-barrel domain-containing protein, partial [Enterococcus faecalis]|uniref:TIM-barrel domain-containing protein n=1 Tax=Enterococcus faecalis TaxID=1351 RepID=UPI003CC55108